jgi:hypothetical protein
MITQHSDGESRQKSLQSCSFEVNGELRSDLALRTRISQPCGFEEIFILVVVVVAVEM